MKTRQARIVLWCVCGLLAAASLVVLAAACLWPYGPTITPNEQPHQVDDTVINSHGMMATLSTFKSVWNLDLRRPLYDRPVQATKPLPAQKAHALPVRLAGTVIEPGRSVAMFITVVVGKSNSKPLVKQWDKPRS